VSSDIAPRYQAALHALDLQPGHRLLEIGCGHGVAVSLFLQGLDGRGHVHAIDRSPKMIEAATRRNHGDVMAGTASFEVTTAQDAVFPEANFDRIIGIRVRELWTESATVLPRLRRWLRSDGMVCAILDDPGPDASAKAAAMAASRMAEHGFQNIRHQPWPESTVVAITAQK
jgi:cyclopropane fatty-acyl-phospholipid synthase-like methyltransferase